MQPQTIAIDGPAGSGKSTVGHALGARLGYAMLDTGLLYRLVAREVLQNGGDPADEATAVSAASAVVDHIDVGELKGQRAVLLDGESIDGMDLHTDAISGAVPHVAKFPEVRAKVKLIQRNLIDSGPTIVAGRDIATVVAPDADLKLYLDVSLAERAARRLWSRTDAHSITQADVERSLEERDDLDRSRAHSPMRIADDAVVVCTDRMSLDETIDAIVGMCGLQPVAA